MAEENPLDALLVDGREIDREKLASILKGRVGVDPEKGKVVMYPPAREDRTIPDQILFTLLGQRALNDYRTELPEGLTPQEISEVTGIQGSSIRPALSRLSSEGLVVKRGQRYTVPSIAFYKVEDRLGVSDE